MEYKIKIVITDSGLGGLNIFAEAYEQLKKGSLRKPLEFIFSNALPETGRGYNRIPDLSKRIEIFNNALFGIEKHFQPDLISIACNTLSVLAQQTTFFPIYNQKIIDIIETGVESSFSDFVIEPDTFVIVFGTETTIESGVHCQRLLEMGFSENQILTQDCPYLATEIELDYQSEITKNIIDKSVESVTNRLSNKKAELYLYFACTHYGYVSEFFTGSFYKRGFTNCTIINPNQSMVEHILKYVNRDNSSLDLNSDNWISIKILSRCVILPEEIESISKLILPVSKDTIQALNNYELKSDLFEI